MTVLQNKYNIEIWQGSTFGLTVTVKDANNAPINISSNSLRMQIRSSYDAATATETLTTTNGEITITDGANGTLQIELSAARTANISVDLRNIVPVRLSETSIVKIPKQTYVYDLELITANAVTKLLFGDANVYAGVTR
jgi:hypothetical protein